MLAHEYQTTKQTTLPSFHSYLPYVNSFLCIILSFILTKISFIQEKNSPPSNDKITTSTYIEKNQK